MPFVDGSLGEFHATGELKDIGVTKKRWLHKIWPLIVKSHTKYAFAYFDSNWPFSS